MRRIHVVGSSPRTGTTLMAEALQTCCNIDKYTKHEVRLFSRAEGSWDIFLTKSPKDIMIVGPSLRVDPDLFVIYMLRDPRDIICSQHRKRADRYWAGLKFWKTYSRMGQKLKDHPRFITVRYEHFVSEPDKVQEKLTEEIPFLEKKISFSRFHEFADVSDSSEEALGGVRPIRPDSVGKWRQHKERIAGQLELHDRLPEDLIRFGYEKDYKWMEELEDVVPDISPGHFPEYMTLRKRWGLRLGRYLEAAKRAFEQLIGSRIRITHPKKWFKRRAEPFS